MNNHIKKLIKWSWSLRREAVKYLIVGFSAFALDYILFAILLKAFGIWYITATIFSQAITLTYIYILNRKWSFRSNGSKRKQLKRFAILQAWNYIFQVAALWFFVDIILIAPLWAKIIVTAIVVSWNFLAYKYFVYHEPRRVHGKPPIDKLD